MRAWVLSPAGVLGVSSGRQWSPAAAEQVYASIVEGTPVWDDLPGGRSGAASDLRFSPYPVEAALVMYAGEDGRPALGFQGQSQQGEQFPLSGEAVIHGHLVHEGTWYPVSADDADAIMSLLNETGLAELPVPCPSTLRQCLTLRKAAAEGEPVIDRLPDDALMNLSETEAGRKPSGIAASLYPYQVHGWQWLRFLMAGNAGGVLADEMGLGKTLQVICALCDRGGQGPATSLVVAPGSLLENWMREIARFCPDLVALKHHGADRTGSPAEIREPDVVVTSYETAVRDLSLLNMIRWDAVVLDEAQNIRNPDARRTAAVKQIGRRTSIAVTGTPVENRLRDLWSIMDFVMPGYLGDLRDFEARYGDTDADAARLEPLVSPLVLRRRVQEVADELPPRIDIPEILELDESEALEYEGVRAAVYSEHGTAATLVSLLRLRQFCSHPGLLGGWRRNREYSKFARLATLLAEVFSRREKALVFTTFTAMADRIATTVQREFGVLSATLDGRLPVSDRQPLIDQFSSYDGPAALVLNPRAGGTGLNIAAANHVIQYNPEWNPAVEDQAAARAHRRGQTRPVTVRRLIVAGTVEEVMDERLQRKRNVAGTAVVGVRGESSDYPDIVAALSRSPVRTP